MRKILLLQIFILLFNSITVINAESVKIIARRPTSLVTFELDIETGNVTNVKTALNGIIDKFSTHFVVDVNQSTVALVDPSHQQHDRIQVIKIGDSEVTMDSAKTLNRQSGVADELISSQSYDWITKKVYIAVDRVGTKKSGRIEACPIDSNDGCTILLSNDFGMHSLVVDPTEGYMYWLNKVENRIESAWMDGQFLNKNPFHDTFSNDPQVTVAALTLDPVDKMLYYLRVWQEKCEIVSCKIHHRSSCKVVATPDDASHLAIYKDLLFWSNFHGKIYFCKKDNCQKTTKVISNLSGFERFMFLSSEVQPQRKEQNLCAINNGGCSHFCLLHPGEPWRNCVCPIGVRLLSDNATCDPSGVRRVLFVAAKTTLFYISLDTREFAPKRIAFEENPTEAISIIDVDYDPLREQVYWLDSAKGEVRRSFLNGSGFEIVVSKLSATVNHFAFDWLGRNVYLLNSENGRLEIQKIEGGFYRKTIIPGGHEKPCCIQVDPQAGYIYFGNFYGEHARIERAWMDGTHRQVLISLPKVTSLIDLVVDSEGDRIYWIEGDSSKISSAKLSNFGEIKVISNDFQHFQAIAKLGDVLYSSSSVARSITAISLGKNDFPLRKDYFDGETSDGSKYEMFDSVIFHQTALKAAILRPKHQAVFSRHESATTVTTEPLISKSKHSRLNIYGCFPGNGGCSEICVNLPSSQYQCLCSAGAELQQDLSGCKIPTAFFVLTQSNVTDDLMRLSLTLETPNYEALAVPNITSIPSTIALDSTRKFIYFAIENRSSRIGSIQRTSFTGGSTETIISCSSLRNIRGIAVDPISDTVFISNGFLKKIEAISMDGKKRRTLVWDKIDPKFLVFHPHLRKLFFVNTFGASSEIAWISSISTRKINVMVENVGKVTALEIDVKSNKLFWSSVTDSEGVILSTRIDTGNTDQLIRTSTILPKALSFYNDNLYLANDYSGTIDYLAKDGTSKQLQSGVPHIRSLTVAHTTSETTINPCNTKSIPEDALCLFSNTFAFGSTGKSFNITWACEDQFDYDSKTKKCIPPTKFILFASKDRIIRYRIRPNGAFTDDPYVVLKVKHIGQPISLIFDSLSPNRYLYWIDAHDRDGGRIKRATDLNFEKTQHISLMKESNCSQIFDLEIDEIGRQLFVSCAPQNAGDIGFIHVWRIDEDDELEYIGKVVAGDRKSVATNSFPSPTKIAVFGRLNAIFYADCSRMLESPVIVRCQLDGRQCTVVVSRGLDCSTLQLEADLASPRLIYTTVDGIWSRDVYVDGDLRRLIHYPQGPQHLSLAPFDDRSILIIASNETKNEEKLYKFRYDSSMQELSQLEATKLIQPPSESNLKRISAVKVVGNGRIEPSKLELSCANSECSHLCRIPYDTGSLGKRRYECLCPLDYSLLSESSTTCIRNLECQNWQFRCFNGKQCIHITRRCDGVADCNDRSDELPGVCPLQVPASQHELYQSPQKSTVMWNCDSGKTTAVGLHLVCNGMPDCVDDSDEKHCRCRSPADDFDCTSWQKWARRSYEERSNEPDCIPRSLMCDGTPNCRNGADELPMLCAIVTPAAEDSDTSSLSKLFDITRKQPAWIIIIFAILFAFLLLSIVCCIYCCYRRRKEYQRNKPFFEHHLHHQHPNASTTLLSTQRTMMTNAAASPSTHHFATARVTMPSNHHAAHHHHQVDIALRTYPCSNTGSDYGYIPSQLHPPPSSTATYHLHQHPHQQAAGSYGYHTLPYNHNHQMQSSYNPHLQFIPSTTDILPAPNHGTDLNMAFYAPPPSAASLSTYGVVKPAFMPQTMTPRKSNRERMNCRRNEKALTIERRCTRQEEDKLKEELFLNCSGPPSYSQIGPALECSTPRSDRPPPRTKSGRHQREHEQKLARQQMLQQQQQHQQARESSSSLSSSDSESRDNLLQSSNLLIDQQQLQNPLAEGSSSSGPSGTIPPTNSCNNSNSSGSKK